MFKQISLVLVLGLGASTAFADTERANYDKPASREETTGFISGALVGGAAGGPPGFIIGAAIGALVGDGWNAREEVGDLQASLYESQLQLAALRDESEKAERDYLLALAEMDRELDRMKTSPQLIPANLAGQGANNCCDNTSLSVHFRTGSSAIESHYEEQLASLANLVEQMPTGSVEIAGYADRNGDASRNLQLSRDRSNSIKQFLTRMGIQNSSINTVAYGETKPEQAQQSFESDFFDRRVTVRIRDTSKQMLTQTPDGE